MRLVAAPISLRESILIVNVAIAVFLIGAGVAAVRARRRSPVVAPNQIEYLDDEAMEGPRLERVGAWALTLAALFAITLPAYWLVEPDRQEAMADQFLHNAQTQGEALFGTNDPATNPDGLGCADCHGPEAEGGARSQIVTIPAGESAVGPDAIGAQDRVCTVSPDDDDKLLCEISWKAPALNTVMLRFQRSEVRDIIVYGRPGTPMPAWGLEGGGAKNDQSIDDILDYLESIQISPDEAKALQTDLTDGRALFEGNCARCHTKHWSYVDTFAKSAGFDVFGVPGGGAFGPNLTGDVTHRQFPSIEDHIAFITGGSNFQAAYGTRGIGSGRMPGFGATLTQAQIRAIVEYERSLTDLRVKLDDLVGSSSAPAAGTEEGQARS